MYLGQCGGLVGSVKRFPRGGKSTLASTLAKKNLGFCTSARLEIPGWQNPLFAFWYSESPSELSGFDPPEPKTLLE